MLSADENWLLKEKYHGEKTPGFFTDCERLKAGEPLAYVIGFIPFLNCQIWLDSKPLIPRPETEYWVEKVIANNSKTDPGQPLKILDLCAGSGCIGVALAKALPNSVITFSEIDSKHLETIEKNCQENGIDSDRYQIIISDLFQDLEQNMEFDLIVSNPPYLDAVLDRVAESVKNNEPALALYGGQAGFALIEQIIEKAPDYLRPSGQLWLEHEPEQVKLIYKAGEGRFACLNFIDQYGLPRFSQLVLQ